VNKGSTKMLKQISNHIQ